MRSAFGGVNHAWCRRCSQQFALLMLLCSVVPCSLVWLRAIGEPSAFGVRAARWNILLLVFTLCSQIHILTSYLPSTHYCLSSCCLPPFERCSILTFSSRVALRPFYEVRPKRAQVGRPNNVEVQKQGHIDCDITALKPRSVLILGIPRTRIWKMVSLGAKGPKTEALTRSGRSPNVQEELDLPRATAGVHS